MLGSHEGAYTLMRGQKAGDVLQKHEGWATAPHVL